MGGPVGDRRSVVSTIVARNYLAYASVLAASVQSTNPQLEVVTLVVDGCEADRGRTDLGRILLPADLGLRPEQFEPMTVMYSVMELCTALKPALLRHLLAMGYAVAVYLDPDVLVLGSLAKAVQAAQSGSIALTPHVVSPVSRDGLEIAERTVMQVGIFNLGFIAVGPGSGPFLDWWHERLAIDAVVDLQAGLFTDQRWVDWVPALFDHVVLRDRGLNVAYWNVHERPLTVDSLGSVLAGGSPLVFFHFSGFEPDKPWQLSRYTGRHPRALVSESPVLADLCADYAKRLQTADFEGHRRAPYGFAQAGASVPLPQSVRTVYRAALLGELPFDAPPLLPQSEPDALEAWLARPIRTTPWTTLTPAEYAQWFATPELRAAAPYPLASSARELRRRLTTASPGATDGRPGGEVGWTVFAGGSANPTSEARQVARLVAEALRGSQLTVDLLEARSFGPGRGVSWVGADERGAGAPLGNAIVCLDPTRVVLSELALQLDGCRGLRIGVWLGPDDADFTGQAEAVNAFDEIWVLSGALRRRIAAASEVRVRVVTLLGAGGFAPAPAEAGRDRVVLVELDPDLPADSQRVDVAVAAYRWAVPEHSGHRLNLRSSDRPLVSADVELVHHLAAAREDIQLVATGAESPIAADIVLSINPAATTGLAARAALDVGAVVVTTDPGPGVLDGRTDGVIRIAVEGSTDQQVAAVGEALVQALTLAPAAPVNGVAAQPGAEVPALAAAALRAGPRPRRGDVPPGEGLDAEVRRLRIERDALRAEVEALHRTRVFRYTRLPRTVYGVARAWLGRAREC